MTASPMATAGGRLNDAVRRSSLMSRAGLLELAFASLFKGLVYPQIWEDPDIDLEALAIEPHHHVVAIASGGCNILSYLIADPARITALDLSRAHIALNRLKLAGVRRLPDYDSYYGFFGAADRAGNIALYARHLAPHLDDETRGYWETRRRFGLRRAAHLRLHAQPLSPRPARALHRLRTCGGEALWRRSARHAAGAHAAGAAHLFRPGAGAAVRQAIHPLVRRTADLAVRARHSAGAI